MVRTRCPYESDLRWVIWSNPIKMIRFNEKWMNWSEMSEMKWNEWMDGNDLEQPYGNGPMSRLRVSLSKWLEWTLWECPYQNEWNRWEMNEMKWIEVNRGKMSDLMEMTWNNPMGMVLWSVESVPIKVTWVNSVGISLWVKNECTYQSDLRWVIWPNPIKMNGIDEKWMNWGE